MIFLLIIIFFSCLNLNIIADEIGGQCLGTIGGKEPLNDPPTVCQTKCVEKGTRFDSYYCAGMQLMCKCK